MKGSNEVKNVSSGVSAEREDACVSLQSASSKQWTQQAHQKNERVLLRGPPVWEKIRRHMPKASREGGRSDECVTGPRVF